MSYIHVAKFSKTHEQSSLATFIAFVQSTVMPCLVVGVDCTEPPSASLAVIGCPGIAWFIHRRYRLTHTHDIAGFCLILLLQHSPSIFADSTPVSIE